MRNKRVINRFLSLLLSSMLTFSLLPMTASAAALPWAADAVNALNNVYGANTFSADDTPITADAMKNILTGKFGYGAGDTIITSYLNTGTNLTRLQTAQIVFSLYGLAADLSAGAFSDCADPAAVTLRSLGIVSGKGNGTFAPLEEITNAELAVIFYRALGKIGAGGSIVLQSLKPGTYGYDELMYLATRGCVPFDINPSMNFDSATVAVTTFIPNPDREEAVPYNGKVAIWNAWCTRLASLPPHRERPANWTASNQVTAATVLDAAVQIVAEDRASLNNDAVEGIFSDVSPAAWFYDGVMYLFNNGIVKGIGTGEFKPNDKLKRQEMAALICRLNNIDTTSPAGAVFVADMSPEAVWSYNPVTHAIANGYMTYTDGQNFSPGALVTRQETVHAIFKSYHGYDAGNVNLTVLERFTDDADIAEAYKTAMAYMVSAGVMNGSGTGQLNPAGEITRAEAGVFIARVMMGLDKSKMHDYDTVVKGVLQ